MRMALLVIMGAVAYGAPPFPERVRQVIETNARLENGSYQTIAARLALRRDPEWCSRRFRCYCYQLPNKQPVSKCDCFI